MKLKWENNGLKSPLARARGLGSAKEGTDHWFMQRVTAIANIPLMLWLIVSVVDLAAPVPPLPGMPPGVSGVPAGITYNELITWLSQPVNGILMTLAVISSFYHAALGTQVIAEDYIHHEGRKMVKLIGIKLFYFAGAVACVFSIAKIAF